jgi:hypothetical protein
MDVGGYVELRQDSSYQLRRVCYRLPHRHEVVGAGQLLINLRVWWCSRSRDTGDVDPAVLALFIPPNGFDLVSSQFYIYPLLL